MKRMKTPLRIGAMIIIMMTALWLVPKNVSAQNENINLQVFYDELGSYGTWIDNPIYGYVWVPNVNSDFRPYVTDGHWVFTDYGWTWSSDLPWGWATFHYGRWYWDEEYGNVWVPGTEWGPAWVVWKKTPGYYGWAPMTPGMNTFYSRSNLIPIESWCFVRDHDLLRYDLNNYYVDPMRYRTLIYSSSLILSMRYDSRFKYSYVYGPSQMEFQRYYGRTLNPIRIYDSYRPGQSLDRDRYSIYRPQFYRKGAAAYSESRPQSYLKDHERINVNPNNNYYRHPRENETGRAVGLYNNGSRNRDNNSNDARREDNRNNGNYNNNNNNRPTYPTDPGRTNRSNLGNNDRGTNNNDNSNSNNRNNDNRGNSNAAGTGNQNNAGTPNNYRKIDPATLRQQPGTTNPATGNNNNNRGGSNASGSGNTNNPASGNTGNTGNSGNNNNNRGGSNASGTGNTNNPNTGNTGNSGNNNNRGGSNATGNTNNPNAGTTTPTNSGRGNVNPAPQTNKPTTPQKPAADPNQKGDKKNTPPNEKKDLRSKVQPISI